MIKWKHILWILGALAIYQFFLKPRMAKSQTTAPDKPTGNPTDPRPANPMPQKPKDTYRVDTRPYKAAKTQEMNFTGSPDDSGPIIGIN